MNVIKLILIIVALLAVLGVCVTPVAGETKTWDHGAGTESWHDDNNWDPPGEPQPGDDVVIPGSQDYVVVISSQDAACKTLDIGFTGRLEIKGKTLTLGASGTTTTSDLEWGNENASGTIRLVKSGGNRGILSVHSNVVFIGGGNIDAPGLDAGEIRRASGAGGIYISGGLFPNGVLGSITLLCNVTNDGDRFGAGTPGQIMVFGFGDGDGPETEPTISGTGEFFSKSKLEFRIVTFAATAPKWVIKDGEFEVTDDADASHWVDVPFDIEMGFKDGGLLDIHHDFSCTGTLTVSSNEFWTETITVASGKIAEFKPKAP